MAARFDEQALFVSGEGGYIRYRIPALVVSQQGSILAFCEARKETGRDSDQIDILVRRSTDGGLTFDEPSVVVHREGYVCGNPAPVLDKATGVVWLPFCQNRKEDRERVIVRGQGEPRTVWITSSRDDGLTWSQPDEITDSIKQPDWGWYATGPGHAIQLRNGRLLIPCNHSLISQDEEIAAPYFAHAIFSDDHGASWQLGGSTMEGTNECLAVETNDGTILLNCRNAPASLLERSGGLHPEGQPYYRLVAYSEDIGKTFGLVKRDKGLPEPVCQASICRLAGVEDQNDGRILFANPASSKRENLTVRMSQDDCLSWAMSRTLYAGRAGYSDICVTPDKTVFCLYEKGAEGVFETLVLARFNLDWLVETP